MSRKILITLYLLLVLGNFKAHSKILNKGFESNNQNNTNLNIKSSQQNENEDEENLIHQKCGSKLEIELELEFDSYPVHDIISNHRSRRQRRDLSALKHDSNSNNPYTIELLVAVDESMRNFHKTIGSNITEYVSSLLSTTANVFADASIGNMINIAVVGIFDLKADLFSSHEDASSMLRKFRKYMNNEAKNIEYDAGLLLTRRKLCLHEKCQTSGIATVGGMCTSRSYALVEDSGLSKGHTIAHELGHLLSALHDDDDECSKFLHDKQMHTMASISRYGNKMWSWSSCSRHFITQFLEDEKGSCLLNKPTHNMLKLYPIHIPNLNRQCQLAYGKLSKATVGSGKKVKSKISCLQMRCTSEHQIYMPWADGTKCDVGKWCHHGECVQPENTNHINGGWSKWKISGQCSRSCGGGIQWYARQCNSPVPKNGGRYCVGRHRTYKSCNTQDCPIGAMNFREKQCTAMNNHTNSWTAAYNVYPKDQCELVCKNTLTKKAQWFHRKLIDGTPCSQNTMDKCVNGICRPAGCDNKLNSKSKLNKCGVCSSNNDMCKHYSQTYSAKQIKKLNASQKKSKYFNITKIPKGATNIEIIQFGHLGDGNFIVFGNEQGKVNHFGKPFTDTKDVSYKYDGHKYEYSSNKSMVKMTSFSSERLEHVLIVKIFLVGEPKGDLIRCSYWMRK